MDGTYFINPIFSNCGTGGQILFFPQALVGAVGQQLKV